MTIEKLASLELADYLKINADNVHIVDEGEPIELEAMGIHYYMAKCQDDMVNGHLAKTLNFYIWEA